MLRQIMRRSTITSVLCALDKHLLGCGVPKAIPCQEEQCQKKFKTTQGMLQHYRVWHTEVGKRFICEKCGLQAVKQVQFGKAYAKAQV